MKMPRLFSTLIFVLLLGPTCAAAAERASTDEFIQKTAAGNQFEIDSSKIAQDKGGIKVRGFARQMIADHTKAGEDFMAALKKAHKDTPAPDNTPNADQKKVLDDLNSASSGDDFNKEYIDAQVDAHDQTVALFHNYIDNGDDKDLKAFAAKTLPILEHHQSMAHGLQGSP